MTIDVLVIGGGPAGLSATVNAAAEGLETILVAERIGGQSGGSSRIENYLGFPVGISGPSLTDRACRQATKFGATIIMDQRVRSIRKVPCGFESTLYSGSRIKSRTVIIACGVHYRRLCGTDSFESHGIHYACTANEVRQTRSPEVAVVGGANSAGQATEYLSKRGKKVHLIVRGEELADSMSWYLYDRIMNDDNVTIHFKTEVDKVLGNPHIHGLQTKCGKLLDVSDVFVMIGARPNCDFIGDLVDTDEHGFIKSHNLFETSTPGIFVIGDVRSGSIKRVANAVGEGAACIQLVFRYLNA